MKQKNLHVNKGKSKFVETFVNYLRHEVDSEGLHKTNDKIEAILKIPQPKTQTEIKQFLGLVKYYYKFIPNLTSKLLPLYQHLKKKMHMFGLKIVRKH